MTPRDEILLARRAKKWTQTELCRRIQYENGAYSKFEKGRLNISAHTLWRICDELELDYPELCKELRGRVVLPNQIKIDIEEGLDRDFYEKICAVLRAKKMEAK
jgi:transcriptional regulator with XRE-family HTH domain